MRKWLKRLFCFHMDAANFDVGTMSYHKQCVKCGRVK